MFIFGGMLVDCYGVKVIIFVGCVVCVVGFFLLVCGVLLWFIIFGVCLIGVGGVLFFLLIEVLLVWVGIYSQVNGKCSCVEWFVLFVVCGELGVVIGLVVGGVLSGIGFWYIVFVGVGIFFLVLVVFFFCLFVDGYMIIMCR